MVDLSNSLKLSNINLVSINHLIYADDMVPEGPSPHSLQTLIKVCQDYAHKNNIIFNTN